MPAYSGGIEVRHLLWEIAEGEGYEKLKEAAHKGLKGLKVAPFYGCQILRPSKILGFEDPDRPWSLERIIEACGGEAIDYPAKIKCCGFPIIQAREDTALGELIQPIEQALAAGADVMVTPCPLCHLSLDAWQQKLEAATGRTFNLPVLHLSQLVGVAAGIEESELKFKRHIVDPRPALANRGEHDAGLGPCGVWAGGFRRRGRAPIVSAVPAAWGSSRPAGRVCASSTSRCPGFRPSSTGCASCTSPTSTSACRSAAAAVAQAVEWTAARRPGPRRRHRRPAHASARRAASARVRGVAARAGVAVLGNHDLAISRDPQAVRRTCASSSRRRCSGTRGDARAARPRVWIAGATRG